MKIIRKVDLSEIEKHLLKLGGGNQKDNMDRLREHGKFFEALLTYDEFKALVFLHTHKLSRLVSLLNRSLERTTENAMVLLQDGVSVIDSNWNLPNLVDRFKRTIGEGEMMLPHLVLRDAEPREKTHDNAAWYLQDGCHRALGYMIYLLRKDKNYEEQNAFLATNLALKIE